MREEKKDKYTTILIPTSLAEKIKKRMEAAGFTSFSSYVTYILRELISDSNENSEEIFDKNDEKTVKNRLRELGYLD